MRKVWPLLLAAVLLTNLAGQAQTSLNYTPSTATASSLLTDKNGNVIDFTGEPNLIANNSTDLSSTLVDIGFDFVFMGRLYTHFVAGGDGQLGLGLLNSPTTMISSIPQNSLTRFVNYPPTFANDAPVLAAFWDDIRTARTGVTVRATQSGFAPARCLVIEWNAVINSSSATNTNPADGVFQMRLYEGSGEIEYVYGKMQIGTGSSTVTASIGFTNGFADNSFIAIKDLAAFNVTRLQAEEPATQSLVNSAVPGVITGLHSTTEGTRRKIAFTPVACNGSFTNAFVNRVYARTMQLNWTDNVTNKLGYLVYRGESSPNNYAYYTSLPPSATSYIATGLNTNTRYYWKIIPYTEGNTALAQELTDSTRCSMTGTYSVGPTGQFTNIKNAQDSLGLWGIAGNTNWELQPSYSFSSETLPVRFNGLPACYETDNTITIRPAAGANISFTNATANPVFLIDSVKNIIIDGRPGGTGNTTALALEGSGEQIKIKNGWNNVIRYVDLKSSTTNVNTSPLTLEASIGGGTHHNLIERCILHDRGGVFPLPLRLLNSKITGNFINNSNTVRACRFYNFAGIAADINGLGWQIDSNSFYATQIINAADTSGFISFNTADNSLTHSITDNYFGGSDIQASGNVMQMNTGTVFTGVKTGGNAGFSNNRFSRLKIQTVATLTDISSKITLLQTGLAGTSPFNPINATVQNNKFGDLSAADSILLSSTTASPAKTNVIYNLNTSLTTFRLNSFVNIRTSFTNNADMNFNVIETWGNNAQIDSNVFSSTNHAYRISHKGNGAMSAIYTYGYANINGNSITNITSSQLITAILTQSNSGQITNNQISHIKTINGSPDFNFYSAAGISAFSSSMNISKNRIISIEDSSAVNSVGPTAIFAKTCNNTIDRNFIDALVQYPHSTIAKTMVAFEVEDDHSDITNNMVRLGLDTAGNTVVNGLFVGYTNTPTTVSTIVHNSFYLAGNNANSSNNGGAFCLFWQGPSVVSNNIMVNERTYLTGSASAIYLSSASAQLPYMDYNVYYHPQGLRFSTDIDSFKVWKTDSRDPHSVFLPPNFVNRNAPTRLLDLHVSGLTVAERRGTDTHTTIADFDGDIRLNKSPVDIGADAGNYIPVDLDAPLFTVVPLPDAPDTTSRFITIHITDTLSGLRTSGNTRPTIWYRKKYPTITPWQTSFGSLESGTANSGNWKFFINHQLLNVNVNGADSIEYYFVAQDTTVYPGSNLSVSPAPGALHYSVTVQVTPPTTPYIYRINVGRYIIPPVVSVGLNQKYTSLTNDGGLFEGIRIDSVEGNITVKIISHLSENGTWGLDSLLSQRHLKLSITPGYDSVFIIKNNGNLANEMIRLYNADNVTIDGRFNGSGRWLRFVNTHSNPVSAKATIALYMGSDSVMIRNTELQNNTSNINNQAIVTIQQGESREQSLVDNLFSNAAGVSGNPCTGVLGHTSSTPKRLRLALNHFVNTENNAVMMVGWADSIRVDSNHIYWTDPQPHTATDYFGINLPGSVATQEVKGNYFGGTQPFCGGGPWINNAAFNSFYFIQIGSQSLNYSRVENNTFKNVKTTNANAFNFFPIFSYGKMIIDGNIIGDTTDNASLDVACMSFTGIEATSFRHFITNNLISGISTRNNQYNSLAQGIWYTGDSTHTIANNTVRNITSASGAQFSSMPALTGIAVLSHGQNIRITENKIFNLSCTNTVPLPIAGIEVNATANAGLISRNRIYNITEPNSSNGIIAGIYLQQCGDWSVENNQIALTNGANTNPVHIYGIYDSAFLGTTNSRTLAYNSVLIGGNQSGNSNSFGYRNAGIATTQYVKNNLLVNVRTGGSGQHGAVSIDVTSPATIWQPQTANYNVYAVKDTNTAFRWGFSTVLDIRGWRTSTQTDGNSFGMSYLKMPPGRLFADSAKGNLDINVNDSICWYVNGRGIPISNIPDDYSATNVRVTNGNSGTVDVGSDEFNTTTTPPVLRISGNHVNGGTDSLRFNGNLTATITWGAAGTLPQITNARFYAGTWPNDTTNNGTVINAHYMSGYLVIDATGGSGYTYNLKMFYDSSMLGKMTNASTAILNKKQIGVAGTWAEVHPTIMNTTEKSFSVYNLTSFSEFTGTDTLATLAAPVPIPDLVITGQSVNPASAGTGTTVTVNFTESNTGTAAVSTSHKVNIYLSPDNILTPGANGDLLLGQLDITAPIPAGGNTGPLNKQVSIPCGTTPGNYTVFIVADGLNNIPESSESNNNATAALTVTAGISTPVTPVITATPAATVCAPGTVTLTASSAGCTACTYNWSNGGSGTSIIVSASGNYTVTVTNTCGTANAGQTVTINPLPPVNFTLSSTSICLGASVTLTATGATSYTWSGNGLSSTTGSIVTATPVASGTYQYTLTGTSNSCSDQIIKVLTVNPVLVPSVSITYTGCPSNTLNFTANPVNGGTNPQYQWLVNSAPSGSGPTFVLNNAVNGTQVSCVMTSNATCANPLTATASETINCITTAVPQVDGLEEFYIAPNPTKGVFTVHLKLANLRKVTMTISDINGKQVYQSGNVNWNGSHDKIINLTHVADGVYFMRIQINNMAFTTRILKTE